jgi:hypothetical protein
MRREVAWLHGELPQLIERGVLTPETAEALRQHYGTPDRSAAVGWGQILLASFGALLVGGGVILILAHNWDDLGRPARAAVAIGLLVVAQALQLYAILQRSTSVAWTEATSGFLVAAVGAAIALVGQTYHLGGSFEGLMQAWLWLVVLIPYITGSTLASLLFWALLFLRVVNLSWRESPPDPWLLVFAAFPFVIGRIRRQPWSWATALNAIAAAIAIFAVGTVFIGHDGWRGLWAVFDVSFLAAIVAAASWPPGRESSEPWRGRVLVPAWVALIVVGTILTFDDAWRTVTITERTYENISVMLTAIVAVACASFASLQAVRLAQAGHLAPAAGAAAALLVVVLHAFSMFEIEFAGWVAFNMWLLSFGILTVFEGVRTQTLGRANLGLLTLGALIVARFFDTDMSFLARGLAFIVFGIACFAVNVWMIRRARRAA